VPTPAPSRDYTALTAPVTRAEVAEFRRRAKATNRFPTQTTAVVGIVVAVVFVVVFLVIAAVFVGVFGTLTRATGGGGPSFVPLTVGAVIAVAVVAVVIGSVRSGAERWEKLLRLSRFAEANGFTYSPRDANPDYPGAIFHRGSSRAALDHLMTPPPRSMDLGNYVYTTGSGKNRTTHRWGFMALNLGRALPHMVLDSRANNGLFGGTNLPAAFDRDQVLGLEGDFDRYFTLYCPRQYERDALYVFTPDLMALLIDNASAYDVEIVDDWMFVYSTGTFPMTDASTVQRLLRIADTVGAKALDRVARYSDDRADPRAPIGGGTDAAGGPAPAGVAPQGRRLRTRVPLTVLIVGAGIVAYWLFAVGFGR